MVIINRFVILSVGVVLLAGCAASVDPREGGLAGGLRGIMSGEYDKRLQDRQQRVAQLESEANSIRSDQVRLIRDRGRKEGELAQLRKEVDTIHNNIVRAQDEIKAITKEQRVSEAERYRIDKQINAVESEIQLLASRENAESVQAEISRLRKEHKLLMQNWSDLSPMN